MRHIGNSAGRAELIIEGARWIADRYNESKAEKEQKNTEQKEQELRWEIDRLQRIKNERDWLDTIDICRQCRPDHEQGE